jgi:hypothetical protein
MAKNREHIAHRARRDRGKRRIQSFKPHRAESEKLYAHCSSAYALLVKKTPSIHNCFLLSTGATLTFEVELLSIGDQVTTTNVFKEIDSDADKQLSREEVSEYLKKQMVAAEGSEGEISHGIGENHLLIFRRI